MPGAAPVGLARAPDLPVISPLLRRYCTIPAFSPPYGYQQPPALPLHSQAATKEIYADASIGNITGSNSVNVFLGLGLPWATAAFYWGHMASDAARAAWHARYAGEGWYSSTMAVGFAVPAGDLGFSVGVFCRRALSPRPPLPPTPCPPTSPPQPRLRRPRPGVRWGELLMGIFPYWT